MKIWLLGTALLSGSNCCGGSPALWLLQWDPSAGSHALLGLETNRLLFPGLSSMLPTPDTLLKHRRVLLSNYLGFGNSAIAFCIALDTPCKNYMAVRALGSTYGAVKQGHADLREFLKHTHFTPREHKQGRDEKSS